MFDRDLLPNPQAYYGQYFAFKGNKAKHLVPCCFHHDKTASLSIDMVVLIWCQAVLIALVAVQVVAM